MAIKNSITQYSTIFKRSSCLNSYRESQEVPDSTKRYHILESVLKNTSNCRDINVQKSIRSYLESLTNVKNATEHFREPLFLIESLNKKDTDLANRIVTEYVSRVLPYNRNIEVLEGAVQCFDLTDDQVSSVLSGVYMYEACDRIIKNHNSISKRFHIEQEAKKYPYTGLRPIVESCAMMIDTYQIKDYQKLSMCIEEVDYVLEKSGFKFDKSDLVKYATEYYLLSSPYLTESDKFSFRKVLSENSILCDNDLSKIRYLFEDTINDTDEMSCNCISTGIDSFLINPDKSAESLEKMVQGVMNKLTRTDAITNIDRMILLLWDIARSSVYDDESLPVWKNAMQIIVDHFSNAFDHDQFYSREDINAIIDKIVSVQNKIGIGNSTPAAIKFCGDLNNMVDQLKALSLIVYNKDNLDSLKFVNSEPTQESCIDIPLNEYKIFKFHNLISAALNLNKYLKKKEKNLFHRGAKQLKNFGRKVGNILWEGDRSYFDENIYDYIGKDHKADICVALYEYTEDQLPELYEFLETACHEFNSEIKYQNNTENVRSYYLINPGVAEIHIKENATIAMTEIESESADICFDPYLEYYYDKAGNISALFDNLERVNESTHTISLSDYISNPGYTEEHFNLTLEALKYLNVDPDDVRVFAEHYIDFRFNQLLESNMIREAVDLQFVNEETKIRNTVDNWHPYKDVPLEISIEAFSYAGQLLEAMAYDPSWDDEDDEDDKKDEKKPEDKNQQSDKPEEKKEEKKPDQNKPQPSNANNVNPKDDGKKKKGSFLTNLKLGLQGLKSKFTQMNDKQKEASRNMDNNARRFAKGLKDALISDRREAIIKGTILPSFSRCLKIGIVFAGLSAASMKVMPGYGVMVPVIMALGGFAASKEITKRERALILDDIETELEVLEKELQVAETENNMNKYRTLLQYKKELQRQYQRIRYNLRVGKELTPSASAGIANHN